MRQSAVGVNDFVPFIARSHDGGRSWTSAPVWPHLVERWSVFVSLSRDSVGPLFLYGARTPISKCGEPLWSDATQGLKQNELLWACAANDCTHWDEPRLIPVPTAGSAEAAGPLCITCSGRWLAVYAPYNNFDPNVRVERNQVVVLRSDDQGGTWQHSSMLRFDESDSGGAESWVVELDDGRLVGTCWHVDLKGQAEYPNAFAISHDQGVSWQPTRSTGTLGQSTALAPLADNRVLFVYNQRKHGETGVWLAVARPQDGDFGILHQQVVWRAAAATRSATSGGHDQWTDFAFGEPSVAVLPDGRMMVVLWCIQPDGSGIRFVILDEVD